VISAKEKGILRRNEMSESPRHRPLNNQVEIDITRRGMKIHTATVGMLCLAALTTGACVTQSTYDTAVADLAATKAELDSTKTQSQGLIEQVNEFQQHKINLARQMEDASSALQQAKQEMETEHTASQERLSKLNGMISQLIARQNSLRQSLQRAQEEQVSLQASVDKFQSGPSKPLFPPPIARSTEPAETVIAPPIPGPVPLEPVPKPTVTPPSPSAGPTPSTPKPQPVQKKTSEPTEEGWLSTIKGWVVSLWRSIFS
jgi:hypothetical protein